MAEFDWRLMLGVLGGALGVWGAYRAYRSMRSGQNRPAPPEELERIRAMSTDDAESAARDLLQAAAPFTVQREPMLARDRTRIDALPRSAQAFFSAYSEVAGNGMRLSRASIAPSTKDPSYVRIGVDVDDAVVIVRLSDGEVFVVEKDTAGPDITDPYRSIWHYVLEVAAHGDG